MSEELEAQAIKAWNKLGGLHEVQDIRARAYALGYLGLVSKINDWLDTAAEADHGC